MEFRNLTPFPALAFQGIDQHNQEFHVIALRQTLTWDETGLLKYADKQVPLCEIDTYYGKEGQSAIRFESDLCQYKPRCDVLLDATAHAPGGRKSSRFQARLIVRQPNKYIHKTAPAPAEPQPLNPFMSVSDQQKQAWEAQVQASKSTTVETGKVIIEKILTVTGERYFVRCFWPRRVLATLIKWCTLGFIRPITWRLSSPRAVSEVPLRNDLAFGGQSRINAGDKIAKRVPKRHQLKKALKTALADPSSPPEQHPIAVDAFNANLAGQGFARRWYVRATRAKRLPAPQIEHPRHAISADLFNKALDGKLNQRKALPFFAGFGVRPKTHPARVKMVGTVDDTFIKGNTWLPHDFDFAIWNAAWPDQQVDYLQGDEIIELTNLCSPDTPAASMEGLGKNIHLRLQLPGDECMLLIRLESGEIFQHPMKLDTLIIEPEARQCHLVWRAPLAKRQDMPIRMVEAWIMGPKQREIAQREIERIQSGEYIQQKTQQKESAQWLS